MIEVPMYKRAIAWLERNIDGYAQNPRDGAHRDALLHSVGVTYNISESLLRQYLLETEESGDIATLSSRELLRRAHEDGLLLSPRAGWTKYSTALDQADEALGDNFDETVLPLLSTYVKELKYLAERLGERTAVLV